MADEIKEDVLEHGVDARGVFVQHYDTKALDASLLLLPLVRFLPPDDPRIRNTVRAIAGFERRPSAVLSTVSELLLSAWEGVGFSTICYIRVRLSRTGVRLTLSTGGHPLPFRIRPDGSVEPVGRPGHILGVFEGPTLFDAAIDLNPGDAILLYTDGLIDPRAWGADSADEKLSAFLEGLGGSSAGDIVEGVSQLLPDTEMQDDVALLAIRATPTEKKR